MVVNERAWKTPRGKVCASGSLFSSPMGCFPLPTFYISVLPESSVFLLAFWNTYFVSTPALLRPAVSADLLEEEPWLPGDKARRCLPAAGPGSHLQRAHKGALCWLRGALQSLKTELCGENRHKFPVQIVIRVFQREAAVHLLPAWRCYHTVAITVELGLGISCLKWLSKRGCICCSISLWC